MTSLLHTRRCSTLLLGLFLGLQGCSPDADRRPEPLTPSQPAEAATSQTPPDGMVWIPGGEFTMGSDDPLARPREKPPHRVKVDGFFMDATPVTNAQFRAFVEATGYLTTAEKPADLAEIMKQLPPGTPEPELEMLEPASVVFSPPEGQVPLNNHFQWWSYVKRADWRHPQGPDSSIEGKDDHPVVQVSWYDAVAYARWANKRLPTEAEREFAARGGLDGKVNVWGDEPLTDENCHINTFQGTFPNENSAIDGFLGTSPVRAFQPNGYGLYDVAGNVWEWCWDLYHANIYQSRAGTELTVNPLGPARSYDPRDSYAEKRVQKGGSYLCNDSYCSGYRPSAREAGSPDTGTSHTGFRCIVTPDAWEKIREQTTSVL